MKKCLLLIVAMAIVMSVISFVGCNNEMPEDARKATVSFAPSVPKSLNQDGKAQEVNAKISDFKWQFYASKQPFTLSDELDWKPFYDDFDSTTPTNGLGYIKNLDKNNDYYFALRAYSTGTDSLMEWEGKTQSPTKLAARNTTVTITVYPVGQGSLYFNFSAPVVSDWISEMDKFVVSWTAMGDSSTSGTNTYEATLNDEGDEFVVNTVSSNKPILLKAGTYLFTVKQQTYNEDTEEYEDVSGRKQVLIVDAQSGVDTVIAGSLDSTSYQVFNYEAGAATNKYGIEVEFNEGDISKIKQLNIKVKSNSGEVKRVNNYDTIYVKDRDFVTIDLSSASDNLNIYVNGNKVYYTSNSDSDTVTDSYFPSTKFYQKDYDKTASLDDIYKSSYLTSYDPVNNTIKAYAKKGLSYLVTITSDGLSKTFSIVGASDEDFSYIVAGSFTETGLNSATQDVKIQLVLKEATSEDYKVSASLKPSAALDLLNKYLDEKKVTNTDLNVLTLTLYSTFEDITESSAKVDFSLKYEVTTFESSSVSIPTFTSGEINITDALDDYITIDMKVPANKLRLSVLHDGNPMTTTDTDFSAITSATNDPNLAGFYKYNKSTGDLKLLVRKFSPFVVTYSDPAIFTATYYDYDCTTILATEQIKEGEKLPYHVERNNEDKVAKWRTGTADNSAFWDYSTLVTGDVKLYAKWGIGYLFPIYKTDGDPKSGISEWTYGATINYTSVASNQSSWGSANTESWYVVNSTITNNNRITCNGNVNLVLLDGASLTLTKGISVFANNSLTIYSQSFEDNEKVGVLTATGDSGQAAIGGTNYYDTNGPTNGQNITINGGKISATGGYSAAGIGGGNYYHSTSNAEYGGGGWGRYIVINGGNVTATGNTFGAGIGGSTSADGSAITINGGTVTASGGTNGGSGIGTGKGYQWAPAFYIMVSEDLTVKADGNNPPTTEITNDGKDIGTSLKNKRYCTIN